MIAQILKSLRAFVASALLIGILTAFTPPHEQIVEYPFINFSNGSILDIAKVEMTDTNTVLTINVCYRPKWWIRISGDSYLSTDGNKYALKGTEGIEPDTQFYLPESGQASFKLIFDPLPSSTSEFDFIEGNSTLAFRMTGVDLTGPKFQEYPEGFPKKLRKKIKDGSMPYPKLEIGTTSVNFHFMPASTGLPLKINMYLNDITGSQYEYKIKPDAEGKDTLTFDLYGPGIGHIEISMGGETIYQNMFLQPGEKIDCYIDTRFTGFLAMSHRGNISRSDYNPIVHTGEFGVLDRMRAKNDKSYRLNLYNGYFCDYHLSGEEYLKMVKEVYNSRADSIKSSGAPMILKELQLKELQTDVITAVEQYRRLLGSNYQRVNNNRGPVPADSITAVLTDKDYEYVASWFDMSDPRLLICGNRTGAVDWNEHGVPGEIWKSMGMFRPMANKAKKRQLEQTDLDSLRALSDPFYAAACDSINQRSEREFLRHSKEKILSPTPDVPDQELFDAIIAPHKGKVVVVDLWNTWCGPCRMAFKNNEPLKENELNSDDIVWIYIADDTSDDMEYFNMIPSIKGIHYRVNDTQIKAISDRFNVDGIPFYILIDRLGNAERRPDIRDHSKYIEAIRSKL